MMASDAGRALLLCRSLRSYSRQGICGPQTPAGLTSALQLPAVVLGVALHMLPREYHSLRVHSAPSFAGHGLCYSDAVAGYLRRR